MTADQLLALLHRFLAGQGRLEELFAALDATAQAQPAAASEFMRTVEAMYARNEIRYDVFLVLKDRFAAVARPASQTTPPASRTQPPPHPTAPRAADATQLRRPPPTGRDDATQLRREPKAPTQPRADADGRTVLRPDTQRGQATGPTTGRTTGQTSPVITDTNWDDGTRTLTNEQPLEPGSLIKGRFLLEERVGAGGMGVVFKARDMRMEEAQDRDPYVAIKFLNPEFRSHPESFKALQRETRRAQSLAHPNVVLVKDFDRDGTLIYMTMEFLTGEPLDLFIQRHPQGLRFREAWPIIEGAGRALMYAHEKGVVHADFKPGNVFVSDKKAKVLDFGIARAVKAQTDDGGTRFDAGSLGALTPAYASPEMLLDQATDPRDDVYALACVSYELMTGRHPFNCVPALRAMHDGMKVKRIKGMGRYQYKALLHGLAFRQQDRTPTVEAFLDEIAGPFGVRGRALRSAVFSMMGTAILVGGIGFALWHYARPDPDKQLERRLEETAVAQAEQAHLGGTPVEAIDTELVKVLLEQGEDYLAMSAKSFDPAILSEGVSSALGAFQEVLRADPRNKQAIAGIVGIVHQYETEISRAADAGDDERVVELAGYARKIDPARSSLEDFERDARARLESSTAAGKE